MHLSPAVASYDNVLLDLDGCLYVGDEAVEGAVDAMAALREAGKGVAFLTNDARHAPEDYVRKLWGLGFRAAVAEVVTAGSALQHMLAERDVPGTAFVVGAEALIAHVADAGWRVLNNTDLATRADLVVIAGHDHLLFAELKVATQAVIAGAELIGVNRDATFPMPDGPWPASGAILAAVETAAGRTADAVVGKPESEMYLTALDRLGATAGDRVLMVGDRLDVDVEGARRAGLHAALVLTGATGRAAAELAVPAPEHIADSLADLVLA